MAPANETVQKNSAAQQVSEGRNLFKKTGSLLIEDIQVRKVDVNNMDIKFIFASNPTFQYFVLKSPSRLVVDIAQGQLKRSIRPEVFNGTLIKGVRQGKQPNQVLRMVVDMKGDVDVAQSIIDAKTVVFTLKSKSAQTVKAASPAILTASKARKSALCSADSVKIEAMQVNSLDTNNTNIKLFFESNPQIHYSVLSNPMRFIVDIGHGCLKNPVDPKIFAGTLIKGMRQGKQPDQSLRLVFDANSDLNVIQSVLDPKVVVFELKNKSVASRSPTPVLPGTDNLFSTAVSRPSEATQLLPNTPEARKGISTSVQEDSLLLIVGQLKSFFTFNDKQAAALELDGGPRVMRGNGTYAYALNDSNRVKLTAEYLREYLDFSFLSGDTRQWVQQGAAGAAYEYLLGDGTFKSVSAGGYYSHAQSKDLSDKIIPLSASDYLIDQRRIAGGNDLNGNAEVGMRLWKDGVVTLGPNYDRVRYDIKYDIQDGQNAQGFGGHVRLDQKLKNDVGLQLYSTVSQLFDTYGAELNWTWSSKDNTVWSAGLTSSYTQDFTTERNFWVNGVNVSIVWGAPQAGREGLLSNQNDSSRVVESLAQWVQIPAVRMPDVLAISDERITGPVSSFVSVTGACPLGTDIQYNSGTGQYSASGGWYQFYPSGGAAQALLVSADSANIMSSPSGEAACLYTLTGNPPSFPALGSLILKNKIYQNVVETGTNWTTGYSQFWPEAPYPSSYCNTLAGFACSFNTAAPT